MFYKRELEFLMDIFRKNHVNISTINLDTPIINTFEESFSFVLEYMSVQNLSLSEFLGKVEPFTIYKMTNPLKVSCIYLLLPSDTENNLLFIGPYTETPFTPQSILEICEKNKLPQKAKKVFENYLLTLPIIPDSSPLLIVIDAFAERIWEDSEFSVAYVEKGNHISDLVLQEISDNDNIDSIKANMKAMEKRYEYENDIMKAISLGQIQKAPLFFSAISTSEFFEKRVSDPLRNMKNYCIVMNTLMRKAAEKGGAHPIYLDSLSSSFATQIEQTPSTAKTLVLMKDMFSSYCRLVRKHSTNKYSPIVEQTILVIESNFSEDLSLSNLAKLQNISPGYLATIFKKETGRTVTQFTREKRINYASDLLANSHLQIQTIASHCGIMDVQYFSKIFKQIKGVSPKEYRELHSKKK